MKRLLFFILLIAVCQSNALGQATRGYYDSTLIQFTGLVLTSSNGELIPVPFATVSIVGSGRGDYANFKGFFSLVARKGDLVRFSGVGFKTKTYTIPDTLKGMRYSAVQLLVADTINLPETVIFPWPDRDNFKVEFLAMNVDEDLAERARKNIAPARLIAMRENMPMDPNENADYFLRQQSKSFYHIGQTPPMSIFDPLAWAKFFKAWKKGDFKKKKDKDK